MLLALVFLFHWSWILLSWSLPSKTTQFTSLLDLLGFGWLNHQLLLCNASASPHCQHPTSPQQSASQCHLIPSWWPQPFSSKMGAGRGGGGEGGRGEETRSGTEKGCSHNLQSGNLSWWSAVDNCSVIYIIFHKVNISESRRNNSTNEKMVSCLFVFLCNFVLWSWNCKTAIEY